MKKFIKIALITAGSLILSGLLVIILCVAAGGRPLINRMISEGGVSITPYGFDRYNYYYEWDDKAAEKLDKTLEMVGEKTGLALDKFEYKWDDDWSEADNDLWNNALSDDEWGDWMGDGEFPIYSGKQTGVEVGNESDVKKIALKVGAVRLLVAESKDDKIRFDCDMKGRMKCYIDDNMLVLKGEGGNGSYNDKIYLYLPKGIELDTILLNIGAGAIELNDINCEEFIAEVGAGKLIAKQIMADSTYLTAGAGNIDFEGIVKEEIETECAVGNVNMKLQGDKEDWDYSIECAVGRVTVGNDTYCNLVDDVEMDHGTDRECNIECSIGKVNLQFQ